MKTTMTGLVILLITTMASASVLRIPADYPDIQSGIEHAATGDTVLLADKEFSGPGNCDLDFLGKAITVQSENGADACIINCEGQNRGVIFQTGETANAVLKGITIRNGFAGEDDLIRGGGGIVCINTASPRIEQCNIINCKAVVGSGIYISHGSPEITGCLIDSNEAVWDGGGIYVSHGSPDISDCTISNNKAISFHGGGIYISLADPEITDTTLSGNTALDGGGIFATGYCEPNITHCTLHDNEAQAGAGIYVSTDNGVISSTELYLNKAIQGGGIFLGYDAGILIDVNNIHDNQAEWGGGIFAHFIARSQIRNCIISANHGEMGGGIYCNQGSAPEIILNTIRDNVANTAGGGICCEYIPYVWESVFPVIGNSSDHGNLFDGNRAGAGADLYCEYAQYPIIVGSNTFTGYLDSDYTVVGREYFEFTGNTSQLTPITQDVYVAPNGSDLNDGLTSSTPFQTVQHALKSVMGTEQNPVTVHLAEGVYSHSATGELFPLPILSHVNIQGAGQETTILDAEKICRVAAAVSCEDAVVTDLTVNNGLSNNGGGIYCRSASVQFSQCTFLSNSASGFINIPLNDESRTINSCGGAVYTINSAAVFSNCNFLNNIAINYGGGLFDDLSYIIPNAGYAVISGSPSGRCHFSGNTSGSGGADLFTASQTILTYNDFQGNFKSLFYVYPRYYTQLNFTGCTSQSTPIFQNVYVKPDGDDGNDGLSWNTAFKTIRHALGALDPETATPLTIYLGEGTYSPSTNGEQFPLPLVFNVIPEGADKAKTILDAEHSASILNCPKRWNCDIQINNMTLTGGYSPFGGAISNNGSMQIQNCNITNNTANSPLHFYGKGGGIYSKGTLSISDSTISGNSGKQGGGIFSEAECHISGCLLENNHADVIGGAVIGNPVTYIVDSQISNNGALYGGGITAYGTACKIDSTIFENNASAKGGAACFQTSTSSVTNCSFIHNTAFSTGGACVNDNGTIIFNNDLFSGNEASNGSAFWCSLFIFPPEPYQFNNCTFSDNTAYSTGTLCFEVEDRAILHRCVLYHNAPNGIDSPRLAEVYNSDIEGGYPGYQNFDLDPLFVTGPFGHYYLSQIDAGQPADSPCKDAGDLDASAVTYDTVDGTITMSDYTTRIDKVTDSGIVDIGYHYPPTGAIPTPTPTAVPTDTPTTAPTAVPSSTPLPDLGVTLALSQHIFYPGDPFLLEATLSNPGPDTYQDLPFVILLDAYGEFFFYPGWTSDFQYEPVNLGLEKYTTTILKFDWPEVNGKSDDILFYGAFLNPVMTNILGSWDWISFQWGQR